jgi:hypothetical protein
MQMRIWREMTAPFVVAITYQLFNDIMLLLMMARGEMLVRD